MPSGLKRSIRLWPLLATNSVLSPATATAPTDVNSPGRRPASPTSRMKRPSGVKTWMTLEDWSPT